MLAELRDRQNLSKAAMARRVGVDDHTWSSWETGATSPSVVDFLNVFEACGESILRPTLELLYPDHYTDGQTNERERLTSFVNDAATDHHIAILAYMIFGDHGSNFIPQAELICAYNHLPMEQRFIIAELIYTSFLTAQHRGDLINTDSVQPDMPVWISGLKASQRAAYQRLNSYTTITEE